MTKTEAAKLWHRVERNEFINELAHHRTKQGAFEDAMLHFDHPIPGTSIRLEAPDRGAGAERIFAACETLPLWQKLYLNAYRKLPPRGKVILNALKADWRSRPAARIAHTDHKAVDR